MDLAALILKARTAFMENTSMVEDWTKHLDDVYQAYEAPLKKYGVASKDELKSELIDIARAEGADLDKVIHRKDDLVRVTMKLIIKLKMAAAEVPAAEPTATWQQQRPFGKSPQSTGAMELYTYIKNTESMHKALMDHVHELRAAKVGTGKDDEPKIDKTFMHLAAAGANWYAKEHGDKAMEIFTKEDLKVVADHLGDDYLAGEFDEPEVSK